MRSRAIPSRPAHRAPTPFVPVLGPPPWSPVAANDNYGLRRGALARGLHFVLSLAGVVVCFGIPAAAMLGVLP